MVDYRSTDGFDSGTDLGEVAAVEPAGAGKVLPHGAAQRLFRCALGCVCCAGKGQCERTGICWIEAVQGGCGGPTSCEATLQGRSASLTSAKGSAEELSPRARTRIWRTDDDQGGEEID